MFEISKTVSYVTNSAYYEKKGLIMEIRIYSNDRNIRHLPG